MQADDPETRVVFPAGHARQGCPEMLVVPGGQAEQDVERGRRACFPAGLMEGEEGFGDLGVSEGWEPKADYSSSGIGVNSVNQTMLL